MIDTVQYKQWVSSDRSTPNLLMSLWSPSVNSCIKKPLTHSFVAKQQSSFQLEVKSTLQSSVFQVMADFSENYSFVLQDEAQGFTGTIHKQLSIPFVVYYTESGELYELSFVIISDCLHHDIVAVYTFQSSLIGFLKSKFNPCPHKIIYFSDGAAAQYKI